MPWPTYRCRPEIAASSAATWPSPLLEAPPCVATAAAWPPRLRAISPSVLPQGLSRRYLRPETWSSSSAAWVRPGWGRTLAVDGGGGARAPMAQGVRVTLAELLLAEGRCRVGRARGGGGVGEAAAPRLRSSARRCRLAGACGRRQREPVLGQRVAAADGTASALAQIWRSAAREEGGFLMF